MPKVFHCLNPTDVPIGIDVNVWQSPSHTSHTHAEFIVCDLTQVQVVLRSLYSYFNLIQFLRTTTNNWIDLQSTRWRSKKKNFHHLLQLSVYYYSIIVFLSENWRDHRVPTRMHWNITSWWWYEHDRLRVEETKWIWIFDGLKINKIYEKLFCVNTKYYTSIYTFSKRPILGIWLSPAKLSLREVFCLCFVFMFPRRRFCSYTDSIYLPLFLLSFLSLSLFLSLSRVYH